MHTEQKIRAVLFYLGVLIFFVGLPFILSFALGYKFDTRSFKFTKTGIIALKTQPAGASVYFNNKLLNDKTPLTINELLPARYSLKIELEDYYPWAGEAEVEKGKVTRLEKIILFPLRPNIKQLNKERLSLFWIEEKNRFIYYVNPDEQAIYISNLDGENYRQIAVFAPLESPALKFMVSDDNRKLLYFNRHQVAIVYLSEGMGDLPVKQPLVFNFPDDTIRDAFWHSDSYHLILITDGKIQALESRLGQKAVDLVNLNKKDSTVSYDVKNDTLYFTDYQQADDGKFYKNLYKIELNSRAFPFINLINPSALRPDVGSSWFGKLTASSIAVNAAAGKKE